ncbi:MAG: DNA-directed RNA polymerase sigma-70 factor [Betaproteobacteria bacterium]|nr:MAG: DNA-directed RNA polymerase sigma-70 factor [Betaproteobacteria bacterium]
MPERQPDVDVDDAADAATVAGLITAAEGGDRVAASALFDSLYRELHRVAKRQLRSGGSSPPLSPTTLLHECYLNMTRSSASFPDRARFVAYAARAMRGLVVDALRERRAIKRGGAFFLTSLDTDIGDSVPETEAIRLGDALDQLAAVDAALAELVELKFYCGFSFVEIAGMRGVSERTVQRDWRKARLLLHRELAPD